VTTIRSTRRAGAVLVLIGAFALAGCGGSAPATAAPSVQAPTPAPATAAPTATPAATPSPTEAPTPAPTETPSDAPASAAAGDFGGFAFAPGDVLDYYVSQGFECKDPQPSTQAAGYTIVRCLKADGDATAVVALVVSDGGVTGNAFAGYVNAAGADLPAQEPAATHLAGFLAAMLGQDLGLEAAAWFTQQLGGADAESTFGGIHTLSYGENDATGVGYWVEVANDAFLAAPNP
jgi:hypothetical protein